MNIFEKLVAEFKQYSAKCAIVSARHLKDFGLEVEALHHSGKINPDIYTDYLERFRYEAPEGFSSACSLIIVAFPQNISTVTFQLDDRKIKAIIPPTYIYSKIREKCMVVLGGVFGNDLKMSRAVLPLKLLAVHSGLGMYGKNSLFYTDNLGSFTRLEAFFVDYRHDYDECHGLKMLPKCKECNKCAKNCPTMCISKDEFFIDAGRCLTYFNESENAFPVDIDAKAHNALIGCIKCQSVCPLNRSCLKEKTSAGTFDEEETSLILGNELETSESLLYKLKQLDMDIYQGVLTRNLKALMKSR
jgi:epoxyqueuosine reductase